MPNISSKELKVIDSISRNSKSSQRDIAQDVDLSLGLTNILINRLIKKGYLKASRLNAKKVRYIITPKGLKEKAKKSINFMKRSFSVISDLKELISHFAIKQYKAGRRKFVILGEGELSDITELVLRALDLKDVSIVKKTVFKSTNGDVVFNTTEDEVEEGNGNINIWKEAEKLYGSKYEF